MLRVDTRRVRKQIKCISSGARSYRPPAAFSDMASNVAIRAIVEARTEKVESVAKAKRTT